MSVQSGAWQPRSSSPLVLETLTASRENENDTDSVLLDRVTMTLAPGEWLYIVGANGSGKSTLGRILAGLSFPGRLSAARWDRGFAGDDPAPYVMQQPDAQLFGSTPREEIVFALEWLGVEGTAIDGAVRSVLKEAGLEPLADLPWEALSGGQRQLAAIAASAAGRAPLLVLDEATSMLDGDARGRIRSLIDRRHREGATVVWITQRLEELEPARRVAALSEGRLVFDGSGEQFLYGDDGDEPGEPPCLRCGLRLPFRAELARALRIESLETASQQRERGAAAADRREDREHVRGQRADGAAAGNQPAPQRPPLSFAGLRPIREADEVMPAGSDAPAGALALRTGRITLLLGANGAGKTRLLELAAGLRQAEGIAVSYGGSAVRAGRAGKLAGKRGGALGEDALLSYSYACQSPEEQLFARSVADEMDYVLRAYELSDRDKAARIGHALSAVGWDDTWLGRDPYAMSGGERRRAALACALAAPAPWLLLDEPTSGLDAAGYARLAADLAAERRGGRGILLVSHEPDWALPLADELLLLGPGGELRHCSREALLAQPDWWREAGLQAPELYMAARRAWLLGAEPAHIWCAADIAAYMRAVEGSETLVRPEPAISQWPAKQTAPQLPASQLPASQLPASQLPAPQLPASQRPAAGKDNPLAAFDPRAVWLSYVLLSLSFFAASGWAGLAASAAAAAAIVMLGRLPLRRYRGPLAAFGTFTVISAALSGLTGDSGGDGWWHMADSLATFRSFAKTWLVLAIGIGLPSAVSPLRLRRALAQTLPRRGRAGMLAQRIVLAVTLLLRFVPQLLAEWERYTRIALARGKDMRRTPGALLRRLRSTAIPFLLSLFRLGETVTLALESRGVGRRAEPTVSERLRWRRRDAALLAAVAALAVVLMLPGRWA
ncbi:ATP-binding cassette domain-containing protein [Cohnella sp. 56]|uniref:ATP-binding cassette domain-containing protein n=1 Tax=Cohnella sp. 56 TaxID=3113722 RepID=UPI0030E9A38E